MLALDLWVRCGSSSFFLNQNLVALSGIIYIHPQASKASRWAASPVESNVAKKKIARVLDEEELEMIAWRAGRGCHFEGGFLFASEFGKQVIQEDVPLLIAEIRKLRSAIKENYENRID